MSHIVHNGGKAIKTAIALRVGKLILKKKPILLGIGLAGIGVLAAVGTSFIVYSLIPRQNRNTKKHRFSRVLKKLKLH